MTVCIHIVVCWEVEKMGDHTVWQQGFASPIKRILHNTPAHVNPSAWTAQCSSRLPDRLGATRAGGGVTVTKKLQTLLVKELRAS
jgi:hypothetical protein